ncbi:MAG TPA: MarR family transcriptional regulator [Candidatus Marinimicrobia bacterium]|jgi:DNA-binding MarR family transcriptional regulator|nr:MarR family transcriptional regulator [Candidatus Neomarinimicrobiota bacterium]|tara:strand:- start:243 stop:686 length:444 start_codon:yes stop_codon:yes gene_type:complete
MSYEIPIGTMEKTTGFLMFRTARGMKKILDARLSEFNVTSSQASVLNTLFSSDGISLSDIGKSVHLDKPAITGLADRMEKDGLVERRRTSSDRRIIQLFLTEKGRNLYNTIETIIIEVDQQLVKGLVTQEIETLHEMLQSIWDQANN